MLHRVSFLIGACVALIPLLGGCPGSVDEAGYSAFVDTKVEGDPGGPFTVRCRVVSPDPGCRIVESTLVIDSVGRDGVLGPVRFHGDGAKERIADGLRPGPATVSGHLTVVEWERTVTIQVNEHLNLPAAAPPVPPPNPPSGGGGGGEPVPPVTPPPPAPPPSGDRAPVSMAEAQQFIKIQYSSDGSSYWVKVICDSDGDGQGPDAYAITQGRSPEVPYAQVYEKSSYPDGMAVGSAERDHTPLMFDRPLSGTFRALYIEVAVHEPRGATPRYLVFWVTDIALPGTYGGGTWK